MMRQMMRMVRPLGGVESFMGGGGEPARAVEPGEYTVILKAGERDFRQALLVEKGSGMH